MFASQDKLIAGAEHEAGHFLRWNQNLRVSVSWRHVCQTKSVAYNIIIIIHHRTNYAIERRVNNTTPYMAMF